MILGKQITWGLILLWRQKGFAKSRARSSKMQSSYVLCITCTPRGSRFQPQRLLLALLLLAIPIFAALSPPCDPAQQRAALSLFYERSGGPAWFNNSGWSDPDVSLSCMAGLTPLPSHCCWYGVSCCTPETCIDADESACNCTIGLVTGLSLQANNVGLFTVCLSSMSAPCMGRI